MKTCPKCQGTNIWYHPENENWNEFYYCPKCEIEIEDQVSYPYAVDEEGELYWNEPLGAGGFFRYFEFADMPAQEQLFQHFYFPELARVDIHLNLENPTTTQSFSVHEQHVKALRDLLNKVIEEIEKENK